MQHGRMNIRACSSSNLRLHIYLLSTSAFMGHLSTVTSVASYTRRLHLASMMAAPTESHAPHAVKVHKWFPYPAPLWYAWPAMQLRPMSR